MNNKKQRLSLSSELLAEVEMAMDDNSYEMEWYLDIEDEKATFISEYDNGLEEAEELREQIENDDNEERFIAIPSRKTYEGWEQMERFILGLDDQGEKIMNLLRTTIQGRGAFRRFKDALYSIGLQDRWYRYKEREDRSEALRWLRSLDLIADEDVEKGMQLYEEQAARSEARAKDIANSNPGRQKNQ